MLKMLHEQNKTCVKDKNNCILLSERYHFSFRKLKDAALVKGVCLFQFVFLGIAWMGEDHFSYFHSHLGRRRREVRKGGREENPRRGQLVRASGDKACH